ncbi:cytochrome P450 4d10-like isoform X2 [Lutzomyia longipalpis]|uniref:cytochrome P450 4d10-like isoform X2 n=1 Tax=Lutzomyia longipalpis TaxID=7200 RepID=UPI002483388B|nr:cytochrome P450 4d10-like isoform X2 [Lutzomyia longipalpis]
MSLELVLICVIFSVIGAIVWHDKFSRQATLGAKIRGPSTYPLIGNGNLFVGASPPEILQVIGKLVKEYGKVLRVFLGLDFMLFVTDPKFVEVLLSSNTLIDKSKEYTFLRNWLGDGLLLTTGKKWQSRRKIITPTFHFKILEQFVEVFDKQGNTFVNVLKKMKPEEGVDIYPLVTLYALDVICDSAMGTTANAQLNSNSEYVQAVKDITNVLHLRMFDFLLRPEPFFKLSRSATREKKAIKVLHDFTDRVIVARRNDLMQQNGKHDENRNGHVVDDGLGIKKKMAFLDVLLQATVDGKPLNNMDIREEVDTFMFEGHDTTTSGISFLLYNIALHSDVQRRVVEEIRDVFGTDTRIPTISDFNNLQYLDLVIKETMRLYPSVPIIGRQSEKEVTINDITIPAGAGIAIGTYFMGRDPDLFTDPEIFNPERFAVERSGDTQNLFGYVPFSAGPRNCIGQKFAILEMKSIAVKVLKNFELSVQEDYKPILMAEIILRPENGVHLKFKARQL